MLSKEHASRVEKHFWNAQSGCDGWRPQWRADASPHLCFGKIVTFSNRNLVRYFDAGTLSARIYVFPGDQDERTWLFAIAPASTRSSIFRRRRSRRPLVGVDCVINASQEHDICTSTEYVEASTLGCRPRECVLVALPLSAAAQRGGRGGGGAASDAPAEAGIPVLSADVQSACGACHAIDDKKMMSRISYRRASPENWELTIRRMMSLNNAKLTPEMARKVIKDLADNHGLAPEEALPAAFEAERRLVDFPYPDKNTTDACSMCHSLGRVISERRTSEEWGLLLGMHRGFYPEASAFRAGRGGGGGGGAAEGGGAGAAATAAGGQDGAPRPLVADGAGLRPPEGGAGAAMAPADRALGHLVQTYPLQSPEWTSWSAAMRSPRLAGRWAFSGYQRGTGAGLRPGHDHQSARHARWVPHRKPARLRAEPVSRRRARAGAWSTPDSSGAGGRRTRRAKRTRGARWPSSTATGVRSRGAGLPARMTRSAST